MLAILMIFYFYTGAFGVENVVIDILIFAVVMMASYGLSYKIIKDNYAPKLPGYFYLGGLVIILIFFVVATYSPPMSPVFMDPETFTFGLK